MKFRFYIKNFIKCPSNVTKLSDIFRLASDHMNQTDKHFQHFEIDFDQNNYLLLNDLSFWDITFDNFYDKNVKLISNNAFGRAAETIKYISAHIWSKSSTTFISCLESIK